MSDGDHNEDGYCNGCGDDWDAEHEAGRCSLPDVLICPFCSSDDVSVIEIYTETTPNGFCVACDTCEAQGPINLTRATAIGTWNAAGRVDETDR